MTDRFCIAVLWNHPSATSHVVQEIATLEGRTTTVPLAAKPNGSAYLTETEAEAAFGAGKGGLYKRLIQLDPSWSSQSGAQFFQKLSAYASKIAQGQPRYQRSVSRQLDLAQSDLIKALEHHAPGDRINRLYLDFERSAWEVVGIAPGAMATEMVRLLTDPRFLPLQDVMLSLDRSLRLSYTADQFVVLFKQGFTEALRMDILQRLYQVRDSHTKAALRKLLISPDSAKAVAGAIIESGSEKAVQILLTALNDPSLGWELRLPMLNGFQGALPENVEAVLKQLKTVAPPNVTAAITTILDGSAAARAPRSLIQGYDRGTCMVREL